MCLYVSERTEEILPIGKKGKCWGKIKPLKLMLLLFLGEMWQNIQVIKNHLNTHFLLWCSEIEILYHPFPELKPCNFWTDEFNTHLKKYFFFYMYVCVHTYACAPCAYRGQALVLWNQASVIRKSSQYSSEQYPQSVYVIYSDLRRGFKLWYSVKIY